MTVIFSVLVLDEPPPLTNAIIIINKTAPPTNHIHGWIVKPDVTVVDDVVVDEVDAALALSCAKTANCTRDSIKTLNNEM